MGKDKILLILFILLVFVVLLLGGVYFIPWNNIAWGKIQISRAGTITVTGQAKTKEKSQIATFTVGVSAVSDDKEKAVNEVNSKVSQIIKAVITFGVDKEDIKTQNLNVYQREETYYEEGVSKSRPGQWYVSNNITIKLRNTKRVSELADLLTKSGATNIYGPNFSLEDVSEAGKTLLKEAVADARKKAEIIAKSTGSNLGKIISVTEGYQPVYEYSGGVGMGGGGGAPIEPGSQEVTKTVTVVFELK